MRFAISLILLAACRAGPPPERRIVQKRGDQIVRSQETVQNQEVQVRDGHMNLVGRSRTVLEESTLKPIREDPFPRLTVSESARLELNRSRIEEFAIGVGDNGKVSVADSTVGRVTMESKGELRASKSRFARVVVGGESRVEMADCDVEELTLRLQGVTARFSDLRSGVTEFLYDAKFACKLERTPVKRWRFVVGNSSHISFENCRDLAVVFEVRNEVVTLDELSPGPVADRIVLARGAIIQVDLRGCGVDEWGLRALGDAVLGARRSAIGEITALDRSRVVLLESRTSGREVVAQDQAMVELDGSQAAAGTYHARQRGRIKMTRATIEDGALFFAWNSAIIECWETKPPSRAALHDGGKLVVDGRELKPGR